EENWAAFCAGRSGVGPVRGFDAGELPSRIASQVPARFEAHFAARFPGAAAAPRFVQLGLAASEMAIDDAGLEFEREDRERIAVVVGTGGAGFKLLDDHREQAVAQDPDLTWARLQRRDPPPLAALYAGGACCASHISMFYHLTGPSFVVATACASGAAAVAAAHDLLQLGTADAVLVGGTDAMVCPTALLAFANLVTLSARNHDPERASRPFDRERDGFVMGEAAGMMILETAAHARRRRARVSARVLGCATTSEAFNITAPAAEGAGMARTMREAMRAARVAPGDVDYVSAHGTATTLNDLRETQGIKRAFGDHARKLWVSSQKSMIGHSIGAAGAIETAVTALTISERVVTPTINYEYPDPECDLDVVPNAARERGVRVALTNSFGFGGHNTTIVLAANGGH
ncbi:MAG TPA: beta-ketoacyl-[acyl-carrier-protein] synthase family protein, partial [Verrucomicrobiae bacterium]|nr:beta-ketoacyl-[acyl-carrier-protein] synthase family protein [Verrucomicrobiae bacterium]